MVETSIKTSYIQKLENIFSKLGINNGDILFVSSDVTNLLVDASNDGEFLTPDNIIDLFISLIGIEGTIIFPTFNWDFCSGIGFDYKKTPSKTGAITKCALKRADFKRTKHPIYSFAVWGKHKDYLTSLDYESSFGEDSIFNWFYKVNAKNLIIDIPYVHSATFIHAVEQKCKINYRYEKKFTAPYTDESGKTETKTYSMFVRDLDKDVVNSSNGMHEIFIKENAVREENIGNSYIRLLDMKKAYDLVEDNILNRNSDEIVKYKGQKGAIMYNLIKELFPICRSLTGGGNRKTLNRLKEIVPEMTIHEVPTGYQAFDWTVPKEWNIKDAWIKNSKGEKIIDFKNTNLHVMGYSAPVHKKVNLAELLDVVYTLPEQPELIPYITSYYKERYGFCMSENQKKTLKEDEYEIFIDSELKDGSLTYGEIILKGETEEEILIDTYICHPSMANNELSGPAVAINLAKWLKTRKNRYTYRFTFIPETIGALVYLSKNLDTMKKNMVAGYVLTCVGDDRTYSYIASPYEDTLADKAAKNVLKYHYPEYKKYSYLERGSNERQYCAPGVELPVCSITRSKYGEYPEYHTSADDMNMISKEGLEGSFELYKKIILALENNRKYKINVKGEPQLGKRGLYPTISTKESGNTVRKLVNFIAYLDGKNDLIDVSNIIDVDINECIEYLEKLQEKGLIDII